MRLKSTKKHPKPDVWVTEISMKDRIQNDGGSNMVAYARKRC